MSPIVYTTHDTIQPGIIRAPFILLVMMGVGEGGFLRTFFCEVVEVAVEDVGFGAFGF